MRVLLLDRQEGLVGVEAWWYSLGAIEGGGFSFFIRVRVKRGEGKSGCVGEVVGCLIDLIGRPLW